MGPSPAARSIIKVKARIALATIAVSVTALLLLVFIWLQDRSARLDAAFQASVEHAQTAAEHAIRSFETVEIALGMFARHHQRASANDSEADLSLLVGATQDLPHLAAVTIVDANGKILFSANANRTKSQKSAIAEYLRQHRSGGSTTLHVVQPASIPGSDTQPIKITRRIDDAEGNFGGVVIAEVAPEFFREFYDATNGGDGMFGAALLTTSSRILSSSSYFMGTTDNVIGEHVDFDWGGYGHSGLSSVSVVERATSGEYVAAVVPISGWPLSIVVAYSPTAVLSTSLGVRLGLLAAALIVVLAGMVAFVILSRNYGKQAQAFVQLEESRQELARQVAELEDSKKRLEKQGNQLQEMADELILAKQSAEQGNRAKSNFLAQMSHELRTPLNAILGFSEIIRDQVFGADCQDRYVAYADDIHSSGRHLLDIINDILDLSKIEAGKMELAEEAVNIAQVVDEVRRILAPRAADSGLDLITELPDLLPEMRADRRGVKQILINLIGNAIKYTPSAGTVTVSVAIVDGACRISVADTGIGIAQEDLPKVLSPFGQVSAVDRSRGGTGLGVPIVAALARLHGGELQIESTPDVGSTFTVTLPRERIISVVDAA
ncbi:MAG: sensor histidine kinase [Alphaproteobacteria bacterium]